MQPLLFVIVRQKMIPSLLPPYSMSTKVLRRIFVKATLAARPGEAVRGSLGVWALGGRCFGKQFAKCCAAPRSCPPRVTRVIPLLPSSSQTGFSLPSAESACAFSGVDLEHPLSTITTLTHIHFSRPPVFPPLQPTISLSHTSSPNRKFIPSFAAHPLRDKKGPPLAARSVQCPPDSTQAELDPRPGQGVLSC